MRHAGLRIAFATAALVLLGAATEDPVARLEAMPAARLDPRLPEQPFGEWLRAVLPPGVVPVYRSGPCASGAGECLVVECDVPSRARTVRLEFDGRALRFRGGRMEDPEAEQPVPVERLSELAHRLAEPIRLRPPECPDGARARLREGQTAVYLWCENAAGEKHGPARSWYHPGRRLKARGRYENGRRVGRWIECDLFERCRTVYHD